VIAPFLGLGLAALSGAALVACSSGGARSTAGSTLPPRTSPPTVPHTASPSGATAPPATARREGPTTVRPVEGSDDVTPPPPIHATGTDYPAIARSLQGYRYWLLAHHPDATLASEVYVRGTTAYQDLVSDLDYLRTKRQALVSVNQHLTFTTASVRGSLTTLRVHEVLIEDRILDRRRRVVSTTSYPEPNDYVVVMTRDARGRWRTADVTQVHPDATVIL
jgi:hypothetical protein